MNASSPSTGTQAFYARKLYALLQEPHDGDRFDDNALRGAVPELGDAIAWWATHGSTLQDISSASDRVSLYEKDLPDKIEARHPISGQSQELDDMKMTTANERLDAISNARKLLESDNPAETLKRLFFWCWRFYPQLRDTGHSALLNPAHRILPDCPIHSYNSTVSALAGAMFPAEQQTDEAKQPYLLLFTFSPVQEFIKASRKFADFWSGSYILHYLSARLCWHIAQTYGPDAVVTPSLWNQEIIDALLARSHSAFEDKLRHIGEHPVDKFNDFSSRSLSTAGFPNTITALVPGKENAIALGKQLQHELKEIWCDIAEQVRKDVKDKVLAYLSEEGLDEGLDEAWEHCKDLFPEEEQAVYKKELGQLAQHGCWEWNKLWQAQIDNTWQPYFVAVPLGHPEQASIRDAADAAVNDWVKHQNAVAQPHIEIPTAAELSTYEQLNVGTWWGSLQARLGQSMQAIKNTRRWQIPTAPGERSSLSGQFSALHPRLHYKDKFKHGRGMASGSIRLFWQLMSLTYPGLFDGSERLNALELTKRMAWVYGGVADSLGIEVSKLKKIILSERELAKRKDVRKTRLEERFRLLYERFSRFPNLSSIAAARFIHDHPEKSEQYWQTLDSGIRENLPKHYRRTYKLLTKVRPSNIPKTDAKINPHRYARRNLNGVMFSSKWLGQDLGLDRNDTAMLRSVMSQTHQRNGFGDSSPADWWVLLLADGDSMGQYVSGRKLKPYGGYVVQNLVERKNINSADWDGFLETPKRMGPATHVGLNRALLDFSNRLVPHLTEHRFCGKVIYSGGDDVLVALPLADLPGYVRSLRAAWCGDEDPGNEFERNGESGYWRPKTPVPDNLPSRPLFTMGEGATMSMGIVIAHKSVPLPTVLENLWDAEKEKAKKLIGGQLSDSDKKIAPKDGLCFKIIYGSGNTSEALMKGHLLEPWWRIIEHYQSSFDLSPVLNRLAEELPKHAAITENYHMCQHAAKAILLRREDRQIELAEDAILAWITDWEAWAWAAQQTAKNASEKAIGTTLEDLAALLKFTAFWVSRRRQELSWTDSLRQFEQPEPVEKEVSHV